jgi:hypothetical protein
MAGCPQKINSIMQIINGQENRLKTENTKMMLGYRGQQFHTTTYITVTSL